MKKQNPHCKLCGRAFVLNPENHLSAEKQRMRIARLLLERISLRGICRAVGVGSGGFYTLCERFQAAHEYLYVTSQSSPQTVILPRLEVELDEP